MPDLYLQDIAEDLLDSTNNSQLTPIVDGDTRLKELIDNGLDEQCVVQFLQMVERKKILKQYDFDKLKPDAKGQYRIWVTDPQSPKGKKRLYGKNLDTLKEKVIQHAMKQPVNSAVATFKQAFDQAQKYKMETAPENDKVSVGNTVARSSSEYRRFVEGTDFGDRLLRTINVADLDIFIRKCFQRFSLSASGRNSLRTLINTTFRRAYYLGWIDDNPASRIIWKDYDRFLKQVPPVESRAYTGKELDTLWNATKSIQLQDPSRITAYAYEFQLITGTRRAEIPPLLWEDVDWEKGVIYFHREQLSDRQNHNKQVIGEYTKTRKSRYYAIAELEEEFLQRLWDVHNMYYPDSPYLFPARSKDGRISCTAVASLHYRLCKKYDIPVSKEIRRGPHAFRRTRITEVVNSTNGNTVLAAQMYGNSPETIRKNYYTKDSIAKQREALNHRKKLGNLSPPSPPTTA